MSFHCFQWSCRDMSTCEYLDVCNYCRVVIRMANVDMYRITHRQVDKASCPWFRGATDRILLSCNIAPSARLVSRNQRLGCTCTLLQYLEEQNYPVTVQEGGVFLEVCEGILCLNSVVRNLKPETPENGMTRVLMQIIYVFNWIRINLLLLIGLCAACRSQRNCILTAGPEIGTLNTMHRWINVESLTCSRHFRNSQSFLKLESQ